MELGRSSYSWMLGNIINNIIEHYLQRIKTVQINSNVRKCVWFDFYVRSHTTTIANHTTM